MGPICMQCSNGMCDAVKRERGLSNVALVIDLTLYLIAHEIDQVPSNRLKINRLQLHMATLLPLSR